MPPHMPMHSGFILHGPLPIELVYSVIVAFACILIFYVTQDLYQLSAHKGIKYFRNAFLFFGLAFAMRLLLPVITSLLAIRPYEFRGAASFLMIYTGTAAVLYVLFSVLWKRLNLNANVELTLIHGVAILVASITLVTPARDVVLLVQAVFFLIAAIVSYIDYRTQPKRKRQTQWLLIYLLLFLAWLANVFATVTLFISVGITYLLYLISAGLFVTILFRVLRRSLGHRK